MVIFKIMCCCMLRINKFGANWRQGETKRRYIWKPYFHKAKCLILWIVKFNSKNYWSSIISRFNDRVLHNLSWTVFASTCVAFLTRKKKRTFSWSLGYFHSLEPIEFQYNAVITIEGNQETCSALMIRLNCWSYHHRKLAQYLLTHPWKKKKERDKRGVPQRRSPQSVQTRQNV